MGRRQGSQPTQRGPRRPDRAGARRAAPSPAPPAHSRPVRRASRRSSPRKARARGERIVVASRAVPWPPACTTRTPPSGFVRAGPGQGRVARDVDPRSQGDGWAGSLVNVTDGFLRSHRVLIVDRDEKFMRTFRAMQERGRVEIVLTPSRSPSCNAYAEGRVRAISILGLHSGGGVKGVPVEFTLEPVWRDDRGGRREMSGGSAPGSRQPRPVGGVPRKAPASAPARRCAVLLSASRERAEPRPSTPGRARGRAHAASGRPR